MIVPAAILIGAGVSTGELEPGGRQLFELEGV